MICKGMYITITCYSSCLYFFTMCILIQMRVDCGEIPNKCNIFRKRHLLKDDAYFELSVKRCDRYYSAASI